MTITLSALEMNKKSPSVWVMNRTEGDTRSRILIPTKTKSGDMILTIPATFVPVDLSMQASKDDLLTSAQFRQTISKGLIDLLSDEEADAILRMEGAAEEVLRLQRESRQGKKGNKADQELGGEGEATQAQSRVELEEKKASSAVVNLATQLEGLSDIAVLNSIRSLGNLAVVDLKYLGRRTSKHPKTQDYCRETLRTMKTKQAKAASEYTDPDFR